MKLRIDCTKEHLIKAKNCGVNPFQIPVSKNCWVALACQDIFPECSVTYSSININYRCPGTLIEMTIPRFVNKKIQEFDLLSKNIPERMELEPFSFEIQLSDGQVNAINKHYGYSIDSLEKIIENTEHLELINT